MNEQVTIESTLVSNGQIALWFTLVFAGAAISFAIWIYATERGRASTATRGLLAFLRFTILLSVVWMLAGWTWQNYRTERPELVIVIDSSESMSTKDVPLSSSNVSRIDWVSDFFKDVRSSTQRELSEQYQLRWLKMAESLEPTESLFDATSEPPSANGLQSRIGDGLSSLINRQAGKGTAAIVLMSDGVNTVGKSLAEVEKLARASAIPIYPVVIGQSRATPDVRFADLLVDREVYLGDRVTAQISVIASDLPQAKIKLSLREHLSNKLLDETTVNLSDSNNQSSALLSFVPEVSGEMQIRIDATPAAGETDLSNNSVRATVLVQDKTIRVLLVQQKPSYEFRFLKHLLERSTQSGTAATSSFEIQSVLQESDSSYVEQDASAIRLVPSNLESISSYDVFIFGELDPNLISRRSQQMIYEAVTESGAGCIFAYGAGDPNRELQGWPLGDLLPTAFSPNPNVSAPDTAIGSQWQPTSLGSTALPMQLASTPNESLEIWGRLPSFTYSCDVGEPKVGAQILATTKIGGSEFPLLITQYAGAGRVALQATDETYRWTSFEGSDLYHQRYWGQMLRWLSRGRLRQTSAASEMSIEPRQAKLGQAIRFEVRLGTEIKEQQLPDAVQVMVEAEAQGRETVTLARDSDATREYSATISSLNAGSYRALVVAPATDQPTSMQFVISNPPGERAKLQPNTEGMRSLADYSRGKHYTIDNAEELLSDLPPGRPTRLGTLPPVPQWNRPWVALLFVVLLTTEWLIRRRVRML